MKCVLIVGYGEENKDRFRELVWNYAKYIQWATSPAEMIEKLVNKNSFLLVIFHTEARDILNAVKTVRNITNIPILVVRSRYDCAEKIALLWAGADEYIQLPHTVEEEIASIRALIRRYTDYNLRRGEGISTLSRYGVYINFSHRIVLINMVEIKLTHYEFDLFYFLASHPGQVFTNEQLYREVWGHGYEQAFETKLNSCIRRIRRKLEKIPDVPCKIVNKWGVGYCFVQNGLASERGV